MKDEIEKDSARATTAVGSLLGSPKEEAPGFSSEKSGACDRWWRFRDSNPGPADYDSVALTD